MEDQTKYRQIAAEIGALVDEKQAEAIERFWSKVNKNTKTGCWEWEKCLTDSGYGIVRIHYKAYRAHRLAWQIERGDIPEGLCVLHKCDNRKCVNPDHLFLGTKKDNTLDMMKKGRHKYIPHFGEDAGTAKLTWDQIKKIRLFYKKENGSFGKGKNSGGITQKEVAVKFGVSQALIGMIVREEIWTTRK